MAFFFISPSLVFFSFFPFCAFEASRVKHEAHARQALEVIHARKEEHDHKKKNCVDANFRLSCS